MILNTPREQEQVEQFFKEYQSRLCGFAKEIMHNEQDAEDMVSKTCEKICDKLDKVNAACERRKVSFFAYTRRILKHVCLDELRTRKRQPSLLSLEMAEPQDLGQEDYCYTESNIKLELMMQVLKHLSQEKRNVFIEHFVYKYTVNELSVRWRINQNTIKSFLKREKARINKKVKEAMCCECK